MGTAPKAPNSDAPVAIKIGDVVLDRYRLVAHIASGGHSQVFRGLDERLSRPVCIKLFSGFGGNSGIGRTGYEHFVQEAFALSRLTHPNTLRIYDFGHLGPKDAGGTPLQVCEFMNGGTLSQVIREEGKQSLAETARIVIAMCLALGEAHALGIVHRDIKPQNILFGTVGANKLPKLADFGIAKWSTDDENRQLRAEDTAIVAGQKLAMYSPSWAAPEQLAGQQVSPATDVYSLACVAIYMLSGKAFFADEDIYAGYRKRRRSDQLVREALLPLGLPPDAIELLTRALAFDPKERLAKVDELAGELAAAVGSTSDASSAASDSAAMAPHGFATPPHSLPTQPAMPAAQPHELQVQPTIHAQLNASARHATPAPPRAGPAPDWGTPPAGQPWMAFAPRPQGLPRPLPLADQPQLVGGRRLHFRFAINNVADLAGSHGSKVRVTFLSGPGGECVLHLKGLTCFVARLGGRPSPAVQLERASDVALVTPRAQEIGHIRVATGTPAQGQVVFAVGAELIAVAAEDCMDAILFDFGPGSEAYFVYTRGRPIPTSRRG